MSPHRARHLRLYADAVGTAPEAGEVGMVPETWCRKPHPVGPAVVCMLGRHSTDSACHAGGVTDGQRWSTFWWSVEPAATGEPML